MFEPKYVLEVKGQEERVYRLECDATSPLGELNDAIYSMKSLVVKQLQEQHEKDKPAEKLEEAAEKCENKCEKECKKEQVKE